MYKNILLSLVVLSLGNFSFAKTGYYVCENIDGIPEYRVYVDLKLEQASFFDNDTISTVPLIQQITLESFPPQELYMFEGLDLNGQSTENLRIDFNETTLSVSVIVGEESWDSEDCREMPYPQRG